MRKIHNWVFVGQNSVCLSAPSGLCKKCTGWVTCVSNQYFLGTIVYLGVLVDPALYFGELFSNAAGECRLSLATMTNVKIMKKANHLGVSAQWIGLAQWIGFWFARNHRRICRRIFKRGYPHNNNGFAPVRTNILLRKRLMIKMLLSGTTYDLPMKALDQHQIWQPARNASFLCEVFCCFYFCVTKSQIGYSVGPPNRALRVYLVILKFSSCM